MANLRRSLDMSKKTVNGEKYLTLGSLDYKYINTSILKSGDKKEYYKCILCPARLQMTVNKGNQIFQSTAHQRRDCATLMRKWQKNYDAYQRALQAKQENKMKEKEAAAAHSQVTGYTNEDSTLSTSSESDDTVTASTSAFSDESSSAVDESSSDSEEEITDETLMSQSALNITVSQEDIKNGDWMCSPIRLQTKCFAPTPFVQKVNSSSSRGSTMSHVFSSTRLKPCLKGSEKKYFDDTPPLL